LRAGNREGAEATIHQLARFDHSICADLDAALDREWLETNGLGGFASSTIIGLNTRRYHGLLIAATRPPVARTLLLAKLEETLVLCGRRFDLSANRYPGVVQPQGYAYLKEFRLDPFPVFVYQVEAIEIEKRVFMVHGENSTVVEYEVRGACAECSLELRPLTAFRDYHATTHANDALNPEVTTEPGHASISPYYGLPTLHFAHAAASIEIAAHWYFNLEYDRERERGLDFREDLFNPFVLKFDLAQHARATVIASTEARQASAAPALRMAEIERRAGLVRQVPRPDPLVRSLMLASDPFIVRRGDGHSVIAGYPWFADWGRDAMITLPGLTLVTGRPEIAKSILQAFARTVDQGMLPNRFPDSGEAPEYNTIDATLWMFAAVQALVRYTSDLRFVKDQLYEILRGIIDWHVRGTRYGIHVDADGCLTTRGEQLTWMDAKVGDWVVTPRRGKPVEVQALWYNALRIMEGLASEFDDAATCTRCAELAEQLRASFPRLFWNPQTGGLYDVVDGERRDAAIRPNQIFALSLAHTLLAEDQARSVLQVVERELLTPYGLRTLAPGNPNYHGRYEGDQRGRDAAYHQGTVWPWLLGPFITAYLKVHGRTPQTLAKAAEFLAAFAGHLRTAGLGQISEIFDGAAPHRPRGCIAQAWSVAEILRAMVEDISGISPSGSGTTRAV
jgi:predicted glycogen debranching enzyme